MFLFNKKEPTIKKFRSIIFLFFFGTFLQTAYSQSMCPITTLKVNKVSGKIVDKGSQATVLHDIKVELRKRDDAETLVSTTITDKAGLFEFNGIKKGEFIFIIDFGRYFSEYRAVLEVKKSNSSKSSPSILVLFGGDCWKTEITKIK